MKTIEKQKAISERKPYSRLSEKEKRKIVQEINSGLTWACNRDRNDEY